MKGSPFKNHLFTILEKSPWPLYVAISSFFLLSSIVHSVHLLSGSSLYFFFCFFLLFGIVGYWFMDVLKESTFNGMHTIVVRQGASLGFKLFLVSEIMVFFSFFWAFFHSALSPDLTIGELWPPFEIDVINAFHFPLLNTLILLVSGFAVTWTHKSLLVYSYNEVLDGFFLTLFLGLTFVFLQAYEYFDSSFFLNDGVYASTFYMLTGLHGLHVIIGVILLFISCIKLIKNHFTVQMHYTFIYSVWYWHFVDIIWIIVFLFIYLWGSW